MQRCLDTMKLSRPEEPVRRLIALFRPIGSSPCSHGQNEGCSPPAPAAPRKPSPRVLLRAPWSPPSRGVPEVRCLAQLRCPSIQAPSPECDLAAPGLTGRGAAHLVPHPPDASDQRRHI